MPPRRVSNYIETSISALKQGEEILDIMDSLFPEISSKKVKKLKHDRLAIKRLSEKIMANYKVSDFVIYKVRVREFITELVILKQKARLENRYSLEEFDELL